MEYMRLLIATPLYPPEPGGPATYTKLCEDGLPGVGIAVAVLPFAVVRTRPKLIRHVLYMVHTYRALQKADAVLALDPVSVGLPALIAARLARKPFYVKVVGDYAWEQGTQRFGITDTLDEFVRRTRVPLPVRFLRMVQSYVARHARAVIVPSLYLKYIVATWVVPADAISVIYNSIELEENGVIPAKVTTRARPRIAVIGRLVPWKHVDSVMDAVAALTVPASLVVVGDGPERAFLEGHAAGVLPQTLFMGALSHADTLAVLADCDVLVLNSSYEGLSHLLIEALMLGKAIIATSVGGNPELIRDGDNGLLVKHGDTQQLSRALERILSDKSLRSRIEGNARASTSRFAPEAMMRATADLLLP